MFRHPSIICIADQAHSVDNLHFKAVSVIQYQIRVFDDLNLAFTLRVLNHLRLLNYSIPKYLMIHSQVFDDLNLAFIKPFEVT